MDTSSRTSEKMRPILQAMERSVESARRRRLQLSDATVPAAVRQPVGPASFGHASGPSRQALPQGLIGDPAATHDRVLDSRYPVNGNGGGNGIGRGQPGPVLTSPPPNANGAGRLKAKPKRQYQTP
jgi:hypothetical protein